MSFLRMDNHAGSEITAFLCNRHNLRTMCTGYVDGYGRLHDLQSSHFNHSLKGDLHNHGSARDSPETVNAPNRDHGGIRE